MQYRSSTPDFDRTIEGFHSGEHLVNARKQADARKLDEVLIEPGGIFEGVVVHTLPLPGRHLHAPPGQIAEIHQRGVLLSVGADELPEEVGWRHRDRDRTPSPEPAVERFARRVLDRLGGRR